MSDDIPLMTEPRAGFRPSPFFRVDWAPGFCPECGGEWNESVQGRWGAWQLWEARCYDGHYWCCDLLSRVKIIGLGYRMDRSTGERRPNAPRCVTEKWYCWPDEKGSPLNRTNNNGDSYGSKEFDPNHGLPF